MKSIITPLAAAARPPLVLCQSLLVGISRWALAHGSPEEPDASAWRLMKTTLILRLDKALAARGLVALLLCACSAFAQATPPTVYEGFTEAQHDILVSGTEMGRLDEIFVEMGDRVEAGEVIAQMDNHLQRAAVAVARAQAEMTGELAAARAQRDLHQRRAEQLRELASRGIARPDELARAETDLRIFEGKLAAAEEQRRLRQLQLRQHEVQLQRRQITAPLSGVVAEVLHDPGEHVSPADPAVVRLLVVDPLHAIFNIPAEETAIFQVGRSVEVFLRSSARTVQAPIASISPAIDGESGTVQVRVTLPNPDGQLRVGDRCTLRLASRNSRRISARPTAADPASGRSAADRSETRNPGSSRP